MGTNSFTSQEQGIFSNAELKIFWNPDLFTKKSDITLKLFGKTILFDFQATSEKHPTDFHSNYNRNRFKHYKVKSVGLLSHILHIAPQFAADWFAEEFIALFGFPC